jgi:ribosomal protein S18 acetylase RimI-like enzyme
MAESHSFSIRRATADDAGEIGRVHVAAWRETYAGIVPDVLLAGLCCERRGEAWRRMLLDPSCHGWPEVYLAVENGRIVGFGCCELQRDEGLLAQGLQGDFSSIYLMDSAQRLGVGRRLMRAMARNLERRGCSPAALWVLRENWPARRFYERLGGAVVTEKVEVRPEATLVEVAYAWSDLHRVYAGSGAGADDRRAAGPGGAACNLSARS